MNVSLIENGNVKLRLEFLRQKMNALNVVTGIGPINAKLMLIGEAPGQSEDEQDIPFIGRAGELLNKILEEVKINREEIFITNTVKCRPTVDNKRKINRVPSDEEIGSCKMVLWDELQIIQPKVVVTLGKTATRILLKLQANFNMSKYLFQYIKVDYMESVIFPMWHPSFLLRTGKKNTDKIIEQFNTIKKNYEL